MDARIISLDEYRRRKMLDEAVDQDFSVLFEHAQELRHIGHTLVPGTIAILTQGGISSWFQRELADEVFRRRLFERSILLSICYTAEVLTSFVRECGESLHASEHMNRFTKHGDSQDVLRAANAAFVMFVLGPDVRVRRSVKYRRFALDYGPSLYAMYAGLTRHSFGYTMAEAFEPLGTIARERFGQRGV